MCKAPKPPKPKEPEKPEFLRNRVLDRALSGAGTVASLRQGRAAFRIPLGSDTARQPGQPLTPPPNPVAPPPGPRPIRPIGPRDRFDRGDRFNLR